MRSYRRIQPIRSISTASSWRKGTPAFCRCPTRLLFSNRLQDLYRTSSRKPKLILISFPHNPTTTCVDLDFFREIIRLAAHHGTLVVHDFAYADIGF